MEVLSSSAAHEFNFDSACTSPYISLPSSPARFGTPFFSAPTSPTRLSAASNHHHFPSSAATDTTGGGGDNDDEDDFAFDYSGHLDTCSLHADELFDGGKIKPLKPPQPPPKKIAFSPRCTKKKIIKNQESSKGNDDHDHQRGRRERSKTNHHHHHHHHNSSSSSSSSSSRSLSPGLRVSDLLLEDDNNSNNNNNSNNKEEAKKTSLSNSLVSFFPSSWYRKWKIKDFLLFRSASEGRKASKAQLRSNYATVFNDNNKNNDNDEDSIIKDESFRSTDSFGSSSSRTMMIRGRRRSSFSGPISAHELHYTINRAISEEMKRKTPLPYKQHGLLGCLGFTAPHDFSHGGGGSMSRV